MSEHNQPAGQANYTVSFTRDEWALVGFWLGRHNGGLLRWHKILDQIEAQGWTDPDPSPSEASGLPCSPVPCE